MASVEYRGMNLVIPENDSEWREHFKLARTNHQLMLRACKQCRLMRYPPSHGCPWCLSLEWEWKPVSGKGHIHSYEVVHHAIQPGFKDWTPYAVVLVEREPGVKLTAPLWPLSEQASGVITGMLVAALLSR